MLLKIQEWNITYAIPTAIGTDQRRPLMIDGRYREAPTVFKDQVNVTMKSSIGAAPIRRVDSVPLGNFNKFGSCASFMDKFQNHSYLVRREVFPRCSGFTTLQNYRKIVRLLRC